MKPVKRAYFGFYSADHSVVTQWLEGYANQGWMLESINNHGFAKFVPTQREDLKYAVGLAPRMNPWSDDEDVYDPLYLDAGWQPVARRQNFAIYCSAPGGQPAPIQAERALGDPRLWRQVAGTNVIITCSVCLFLLLAIFVFLYLTVPVPLPQFFLRIDKIMPFVLLGFFGCFSDAIPTLRSLRYWRVRRQQLWQEEPASVPSLPQTRRRIHVNLIFSTLAYICLVPIIFINAVDTQPDYLDREDARPALVLTTEDLGLGEASIVGFFEDSYFLSYHSITQFYGDAARLDTYRYDCRYGWLAALTLDGLKKDLFGDKAPVSFFDECYFADDGSALLLRQENTVILLVGPPEIFSVDTIAHIRAGLSQKE